MPGMNVVILDGSFNTELAREILQDVPAGSRTQSMLSGLKRTVLHGKAGSEHVNTELVPMHTRKTVEHVVRVLEGVRRLFPLRNHVYFVINEQDKPLFYGSDLSSLFTSGLSDLQFTEKNIICNGARKPDEWRGDVSDLKLALQHIGTDSHVVAISSDITFMPGFGMQRVIEHTMIRDRDAVAINALTVADVALVGASGHAVVQAADTVPIPPLASIALHSQADVGVEVVEPLLILKPSTLKQHVMSAASNDLVSLAAELLHQRRVALHGVDLGYGRLYLRNAACLDYVDRLTNYYINHITIDEAAPAEDDEFGAHDVAAQAVLARVDRPYAEYFFKDPGSVQKIVQEFDKLYFGGDRAQADKSAKFYQLPPTFYMTSYRRQAADVMR